MSFKYKVGHLTIELIPDENHVAVRFKEPALHSTRAAITEKCAALGSFRDRVEVPEEKYTILPVAQAPQASGQRRTNAMNALAKNEQVSRVASVFKHGNKTIIATDRVLVGFKAAPSKAAALIKKHKAKILERNGNEYALQLAESADPLEVVKELAKEKIVDYAEPDFVSLGSHIARRMPRRPSPAASDPLTDQQYAITITKAVEAWRLQSGDPGIIIAILDEGVDTSHEDLGSAIVGNFDGVDGDTFQEPNPWDGHGTACAGLAAAIHNNDKGIKGIGGGCSLQAVRIAYSPAAGADWITRNSWISRAIDWAWQNGASVLSNSWGGGAPSTAIMNAFERARTQGRGGKGCVIVVAAGNDSGPVDFPGNLPNVLTVSASNEFDEFKTKTSRDGEHWWGSNFGPEVDLAAPGVHNQTTDISGASGYTSGNYTDFNGTSSATPIVAGAAGLLLSANPELTELEVRERLKQVADKVGALPYTDGRNDQFGHGRLNVLAALQISQPAPKAYTAIHTVKQNVPIKDNETSRIHVAVGDSKMLKDIKVHVEIEHTYIGDLLVRLMPPPSSGEAAVTLHDRKGRDQHNLIATFDTSATPDLTRLLGKNLQGEWMLEVLDTANQDEGSILSLSLEMEF